MCKTCNGTGKVILQHDWGVSFNPCPSTNCNFVTSDDDLDELESRILGDSA